MEIQKKIARNDWLCDFIKVLKTFTIYNILLSDEEKQRYLGVDIESTYSS